jgi:hypothetical protein
MNIRCFLLLFPLTITQNNQAALVRTAAAVSQAYTTAKPAVLTSIDSQKFPILTHFVKHHAMLPRCAQKAFEKVIHNPLGPNEVRKVQGEQKNYYVKTRFVFNRLLLAQRISECIKEHNLTCLTVPKKYLGYAHGMWYAIAEEAQGSPMPPLDMKTMKQLVTVVQETGLCDIHGKNMLHHNGKISFVDTEMSSRFRLEALCGLLRISKPLPLSLAARYWIYQHTVKQIVGEDFTKRRPYKNYLYLEELFKEALLHSQETTGTILPYNIGGHFLAAIME